MNIYIYVNLFGFFHEFLFHSRGDSVYTYTYVRTYMHMYPHRSMHIYSGMDKDKVFDLHMHVNSHT